MAAVPFKVKAIYEYTSAHEDDLPFGVGQIITVTDDEDPDWYGGDYVDDLGVRREGIFPRNFVEKYEPTAPPRPTRSRKKESEPASPPPPPPPVAPAELLPVEEPVNTPPGEPRENPRVASPPPLPQVTEPRSPPPPVAPVARPPELIPIPAPVPVGPRVPMPASPTVSQPPPKPAQVRATPPVSEKPTSNSFKDRIAAFNKPAAPPVAPFKPSSLSSGSSGFIKKPFVAPPPSRNAYVPPPREVPTAKVYRREEDPEIKATEAESLENAAKAGLVPTGPSEGQGEEQPKPTSLKERIALLQKQQAEAAQRHAEAVAKKEKPKRPPKKRTESDGQQEGVPVDEGAADVPLPLEGKDAVEITSKKSIDEARPPRQPLPARRKSTTAPAENDGNEADMSGAGDTTEGQEDLTEREDSDERSRPHTGTAPEPEAAEGAEVEEEEEVDPEVRRKEELRARMAKMSGGMGMHGMFGPPGMMPTGGPAIPKKPKPSTPSGRRSSEISERPSSPRMAAPPIPTPMALPGFGRPKQQEEVVESDHDEPSGQEPTPVVSAQPTGSAPEARPPPPPPTGVISPSLGSESDDELSENPQKALETPRGEVPPTARAPPVPLASPIIPTSPRVTSGKRTSYMGEEASPSSPPQFPSSSKRNSRPPPPIPGAAPPPLIQSRPPPPPPPAGPPSRSSTADERIAVPMRPGTLDNGEEGEVTEYEGDYDTDIGSSVPHKDALKSHARDSSFDDSIPVRSPVAEAPPSLPPPVPRTVVPRAGPPPVPSQAAPASRLSVDSPRAIPPPPPPPKEVSYSYDDDYDPYNYNAMQSPPATAPHSATVHEDEELVQTPQPTPSYQQSPLPPPTTRGAPPQPPRAPPRKSIDVHGPGARRSVDAARPSMETGFVANEIDLARHTQWWLAPNGLPPVFQGRRDIYTETDESTSGTSVTKAVFILFQDYSQTVITVRFDSQTPSDAQLEQRHEGPPRALRQDELEDAYERFGRAIASVVGTKNHSVAGDGSPQALIFELLQPLKDALLPVGTRAYGALVYANLANASTQLNDEIRPGDILSIRNAKFQGKHGPMHAKYSMEVGKPDHVAIVAEWDGTKKKVRAWEQGRESKKVKQESFKLDDLRSGEVKIWRVMPRSWVGWSSD
ncbi:assembly of actin patch protein [Parahypoxylon ruwenzoriense]